MKCLLTLVGSASSSSPKNVSFLLDGPRLRSQHACHGASHASLTPSRLPLYLASLLISLVFLLVNLTCAVLVKTGSWERKAIVSVRVAINDTLFVLCAVSLSVCLYKISKMSLANIYLESKVRWKRGQEPSI